MLEGEEEGESWILVKRIGTMNGVLWRMGELECVPDGLDERLRQKKRWRG